MPVRPRRGPVFGIMPRNLQQTMALDLLLDDSVKLVSLIGSAGTGKTLLAIAAGMTKVLNEQVYQKLLCARPIMPLGPRHRLPARRQGREAHRVDAADLRQHGLPAVATACSGDGRSTSRTRLALVASSSGSSSSIETGQVVLEPLTYIRGRSIPHQFMIVDEAQNLTPHEVKTIASRVGEGTKLVLTGDATQIDNPYLDSSSNGL